MSWWTDMERAYLHTVAAVRAILSAKNIGQRLKPAVARRLCHPASHCLVESFIKTELRAKEFISIFFFAEIRQQRFTVWATCFGERCIADVDLEVCDIVAPALEIDLF